jgi:hypothetical protein
MIFSVRFVKLGVRFVFNPEFVLFLIQRIAGVCAVATRRADEAGTAAIAERAVKLVSVVLCLVG